MLKASLKTRRAIKFDVLWTFWTGTPLFAPFAFSNRMQTLWEGMQQKKVAVERSSCTLWSFGAGERGRGRGAFWQQLKCSSGTVIFKFTTIPGGKMQRGKSTASNPRGKATSRKQCNLVYPIRWGRVTLNCYSLKMTISPCVTLFQIFFWSFVLLLPSS